MAINLPYSGEPQNQGYNNYASGKRHYGFGGRPAPNVGAVQDTTGYAARDRRHKARQQALSNLLQRRI